MGGCVGCHLLVNMWYVSMGNWSCGYLGHSEGGE